MFPRVSLLFYECAKKEPYLEMATGDENSA